LLALFGRGILPLPKRSFVTLTFVIRSAREGPTIHAFTHSLSHILSYLRETLAGSPPSQNGIAYEPQTLIAVWAHYSEIEELVVALSALCDRVSGQLY
jgi:hypothetical protein